MRGNREGSERALPWVGDEIDKALAKERCLLNERGANVLAIIPLDLDGSLFAWTDGRKDTLQKRFAPSFKGWEKDNDLFEQQFERVVKALRTDGGHLPPPKPKL